MSHQNVRRSPDASVIGYDVLCHFQAGGDSCDLYVSDVDDCRFCGEKDRGKFRQRAHSVPQGVGNRWLLSQDECDACNAHFSRFEGSLCASVGPILTIGGSRGKRNKVRQSGRSNGSHNIRHVELNGQRRISINILDIDNGVQPPQGTEVSFSGEDTVSFDIPAPPENFVPRDAYKALIKIGLGIMPANELANFRKLLNWLRNDSDQETFPFLDVGISTGSLGNAPRYVAATLLKRTEPTAQAPYMILILTAGSVCWQLDLMPDALDDHCELARFGSININWRAFLQAPSVETIEIAYDQPRHFDWSSPLAVPIPVESIKIEFDWRSNMTNILVRWREMSPGD